jgi:hypothetical protein
VIGHQKGLEQIEGTKDTCHCHHELQVHHIQKSFTENQPRATTITHHKALAVFRPSLGLKHRLTAVDYSLPASGHTRYLASCVPDVYLLVVCDHSRTVNGTELATHAVYQDTCSLLDHLPLANSTWWKPSSPRRPKPPREAHMLSVVGLSLREHPHVCSLVRFLDIAVVMFINISLFFCSGF